MILSLCQDSARFVQGLYDRYPRDIFGLSYHFHEHDYYAGILAQGEDLFLSAHCYGEVVGGESGVPYMKPEQLARWLEETVFPWNYSGRLYLSFMGEPDPYVVSLSRHLGLGYEKRVYSSAGQEGADIYPPGHLAWSRLTSEGGFQLSN